MSFIPFTEKNKEEKNWNLLDFWSDLESDPESELDPDPELNSDPLSQKQIRGSCLYPLPLKFPDYQFASDKFQKSTK